jgi:hypothetical protein
MPVTVYSNEFRGEFDAEQLVVAIAQRLGVATPGPDDAMPDAIAKWLRIDAECPSCFIRGATVVRAARSKATGAVQRQRHFRFITESGDDAHLPLCDYFRRDEGQSKNDYSVDFANDRSALTRAVRKIVCVGIEQQMFSQADMHRFRRWHFEIREKSRFEADFPDAAIDWCRSLLGQCQAPRGSMPFRPELGLIPTFDWDTAAKHRLGELHAGSIEILRAAWVPGVVHGADRSKTLIAGVSRAGLFDPTPLRDHYNGAVQFAAFAARYLPGGDRKEYSLFEIGSSGPGRAVMALCALLLFISDWNLGEAAAKFARLIAAEPPRRLDLGNIVGFNPFHDFPAWTYLKAVCDVVRNISGAFDFSQDVAATAAGLRAEFAAWQAQQ